MSQGTSDSSSGSRGELPSQAGVGHSQTAKRGGRCWAGAGQDAHQAAPATAAAAAQCGKEGPGVPGAQIQQDRTLVTGMCPRSIRLLTPQIAPVPLPQPKNVFESSLTRHSFPPHLHPDYGFCHVSHWLWGTSSSHTWDTLYCTVEPPFTAWCILRNAPIHVSVVRVVVFTYGLLLSEDSPSIGLTLLNINGLLLDDDIQAQQHFT